MRAEREDEGLTQGAPRDMRGHYPAGLAESVRAVRAYRAEHPESADVLDRLNRAVYGYRRNNGWSVPLLSREGERLQGVRTALPDDGASEAVVGGGRGLTSDAGADANAAALQGLPESAAVASGNAPTHQQNLQVRAHAEGAAPGLSASENLAGTDGGKGAPVAGKRPDTVLPVLNPQVAESAVKVSPKKRMADAAADFTRRLAADRRKLEKAGVPLGDGEYRFEHTNRRHIDALAGVLDRLGKGGILEEFADMAGSSNSDGLVFDGRRYLKGKEAETLQAGGLLETVPSKSGWDYRLTQEGRALAKVMARSRDAAADGKPADKAQSARAKDAPVAGKAAVAKNATTEKPSSDKVRNIEAGKSHFDGGKGKSAAAQGAADEMPSEKTGKAKPETLVKTALDNPEEARRKARVLQGEPVYTVKERTAPQGFKALREWAAALFEKAGGKAVNPEAGEILLNERSVRDSIAHGMNPFKAEAFAAIPDVISQGVVIHEGVNPENGARYVYISAPVEIGGKDDVVTLLARNTGNGSQMYLHSVATKESILNASDTETAEISRETGKVNSGYIASVLKKLLEYKTETGKGVSVGKKQQKRQAESEAGSVPSEAQPKSGKDYFGLSLYESGQDYKGISEAHYRKFVAELSKLDGWRVNNRKYGKLEFRVDGEEVVFLRRLESLYSEHAVIGFSVYNSRLVEKKFDEIEFVFNPSEPPKETAERLNRFIRSIYPVSEASVQVESNPESEADTHRTPESVRAFSVTLPKLQQKRAVEHLTADALLDGGAKYPQLNGRTTKAGQVEKTLSAGFVPYEEIREQTARMGKERDKMFFKLHREAYGEDSSFDYDNSDDAELKAQTDEALREKYPPKTVYLMKHKQSGDALPITKTQFDYAVYLENMPSEGLRFSLNESPDSAFARAVDDVTGGKVPAGFISLGTTPDVWKLVGLPDGKVRISGGVIDKAMNGKHSVTAEALKDLPRHLNSPIAVFKSSASSSNPDGYVVLTELVEREKDKDKPIIAALNLGRAKNGLELLDISSVYGRNNGQLTRAFNQDLLYLDKAKGRHFLTTRPLQLHWDITSDADLVGRNIKTDSDLAQYSSAKKQVPVDKAQRMARQHAESIKKRLAESIGGLVEQVDVAAVSETAPDKAQMLLSERVEGWFDGRTGKITLVAENLTPERAVWVAWHELGHRGFAADGFAKYRAELERADGNSLIRRIADAVQEEREGTGDAAASVRSVAVEEAIVELYAAQRTGDWSGIENRYGVKVGNGLKRGIAGVLARIGAVLRRVLQRLAGKADGAMSDADVFAMLADLHGNAEGARDASSDGVKPSRSAMKDTDANIRRGRAAMNRALVEKADVRRAMYRNDIGWIDFVWGSTGRVLPNGKTKGAMGLAHVIESRMRKDGMSRDEVVGMLTNDVVEAIARGKVYKHVVNGNSERLQLRHNGYEANLIKNAGNNAWLITGYELYQNGADGVGFDTSAATHTTPTPARRDVGASDTPNVRAKDESVNTADGTRNSRAAERSKSESLEKLRRAETIRISGREIEAGDDLRQYRRRAMEYGKSLRGSYVNKDTGREISLGRAGITEVLHHDVSNPEHLQSIAAIPQIIEKSIYIDTLPNEDKAKNPDIQEYEYYVAGLNIGGTDYTVKAAIAVATTGDKYYDHKLTRIEKGDLLEMTSRLSGAEISNQSPLSGIDDKRLLQILQDKDAGKGGIADFDTEAVRFSRAANIGAAISHITGKKSDLRNALKDRWDASKGIQLQFLGRRQIEDIYGGSLDGLKEYGRLSELFGADANKAVTEADKVVREWGRLKKEDAKALADLMHDATLAKVDADPLMRGDAQKRLDGIRTALDIADGKIGKAKAVIASADARIARADAAYNKASEAAKKAQSALLAAEEKAGREILADEADMRLSRLFYADSEAKRALRHAQADVMAESRAKTDAVQMLKQARADVRRLEKDEVEAQKALEGLALLNRRFAKLPDAAQKVYRKARDDYRAHFGQVRDAIAERLARSGQDAEIVRRLKERFDNELGGVYFPLARFGDYLVVVKDADGNNVNVSRAETLSEAEKLRDALKADFGAGFKVSPVMKSRDYIQSRDAVGSGFMKELGEAVGMLDLDSAQRAELNDTLTQLYLNSLPDTSWAKHGIHRKGVPGFSDDARRAYAQNMGSGANYLAKLRYADRMAEQLDVMQDFVDGRKYEEGFNQRQLQRVADEMRKRHEAVMNPNPSKLAQALTGFGFLWMMGMSPASAIVNLSQTAMVAYPVMAAKWGYADAARELLRASKQIGLKVGEKFNTIEDSLNEDEKAAFQKAVDYGVIDLSQAHDLAGVANGDPGLAGSAWQKVMDKASWLFHHAEKFNRQVTFVAAYRLAKRAGADSEAAFEQAKKATYDGHFDYAAQNRPRFMMGNVAKVVFLFKQYSQNILYALGRNAYLAFKGDKEARKTLAGLLVSHATASGILGLPFVSALLAVASMLGSDDDDPWIPSATCCTASPCPASKPT
nr:PLxRFG domain-containing protein [Neisseria lactamica]